MNNYKKYISEDEEIRCWFKVSSNRKKVWNVQLWLLEELKKICEKHNIKYYASGGTLLWAIRHKWFIPWDDDLDIMMFREDYQKFLEIAQKELPDNIKLWKYHRWFSKLVNTNTAAFWEDNWWDKDSLFWINIDLFSIDNASRFMLINQIKSIILRFLCAALVSRKSHWFTEKTKWWKKIIIHVCNFIFKKIDYAKIYEIREKISKKILLKWNNVYSAGVVNRYFPSSIYDKSHDVKFENTTINVPDWYDVYLKKAYWDYMEPVIYEWWHNCWYSLVKSYKEIIKTFDKSKTNEDNYNDCKDLFTL